MEEKSNETKLRKTRFPNYTESERALLLNIIKKHAVVDNKNTTAQYNKMKESAWQMVMEEFNSSVVCNRNIQQLQKLYQKIKWAKNKAKQKTIKQADRRDSFYNSDDAWSEDMHDSTQIVLKAECNAASHFNDPLEDESNAQGAACKLREEEDDCGQSSHSSDFDNKNYDRNRTLRKKKNIRKCLTEAGLDDNHFRRLAHNKELELLDARIKALQEEHNMEMKIKQVKLEYYQRLLNNLQEGNLKIYQD